MTWNESTYTIYVHPCHDVINKRPTFWTELAVVLLHFVLVVAVVTPVGRAQTADAHVPGGAAVVVRVRHSLAVRAVVACVKNNLCCCAIRRHAFFACGSTALASL